MRTERGECGDANELAAICNTYLLCSCRENRMSHVEKTTLYTRASEVLRFDMHI